MDIPQKQPRLPLDIQLIVADTDPAALEAWAHQFAPKPPKPSREGSLESNGSSVESATDEASADESRPVEIHDCDFLDVEADALIVPGNSFGFLDGGVELRVAERLGLELQDRLRSRIRNEFAGELLVGQAIIEDPSPKQPAIIYAPIWRTPQDISTTVNVFLAARGAFQALHDANRPTLRRIVAPAIGVGEPGCMHAFVSARQFRYAYEIAIKKRSRGGKNLTRIIRRERKMKAIPGAATAEATAED